MLNVTLLTANIYLFFHVGNFLVLIFMEKYMNAIALPVTYSKWYTPTCSITDVDGFKCPNGEIIWNRAREIFQRY